MRESILSTQEYKLREGFRRVVQLRNRLLQAYGEMVQFGKRLLGKHEDPSSVTHRGVRAPVIPQLGSGDRGVPQGVLARWLGHIGEL